MPQNPLFLFLAALVAHARGGSSGAKRDRGNRGGSLDEHKMMTPPPVSGMPYANTAGSDARSNYLASECDLFAGLYR